MENEELEKMYDEYYMTAEGIDKSYIRGTLALDLTGGMKRGIQPYKRYLSRKN